MKHKQFAAIALIAWLAVVGWVASMILAKPQAFAGGFTEADGMFAAQIEQDIVNADRMTMALASLEAPPAIVAGPRIVAEPPAQATTDGVRSHAAGGGADGEIVERMVSFIISGDGFAARAMIDGNLVGRGARLPDGAIVRGIDARSVRIEGPDGQTRTVPMRSPGDAATTPESKP